MRRQPDLPGPSGRCQEVTCCIELRDLAQPQRGPVAGGNLRMPDKLSTIAQNLPAQLCYPCGRENGNPNRRSKAGSLRAL